LTTNEEDIADSGWLTFAGVILIVMAVMRFIDAIWAWRYKGAVPDNLKDGLFGQTLSTYGWVWLVMAILLFLAGLGVMVKNQYARWFGIIVAAFAAISSMAWMPYYPVWALVYIGVGFLVIYALANHGARDGMY
jgi:hypothetical protein